MGCLLCAARLYKLQLHAIISENSDFAHLRIGAGRRMEGCPVEPVWKDLAGRRTRQSYPIRVEGRALLLNTPERALNLNPANLGSIAQEHHDKSFHGPSSTSRPKSINNLKPIHTYIHPCMHACIHTYKHTHIHTYIHTYNHPCMHACMHACMHTYKHTHIHTYIHPSIHACMHAYIHTNIHTYIHTYVHACMHPCMHV